MNRLCAYIEKHLPKIHRTLDRLLPRPDQEPSTLYEAMRYSVLGGGKRLRPLLCLMSARLGGEEKEDAALVAACAIELVHTYSLIHDDLPAMDNDEMRRGKLTCHKAFGEANAILAGDALLTLAFEVLAEGYPPELASQLSLILAKAAGHAGMVGGQVLDLEGEGKQGASLSDVEAIHRRKTGALIEAACRMGGCVAGVDASTASALTNYGKALGLAFQIMDDIFDIEMPSEKLGKTAGKDRKQQKLTYPSIVGLSTARELAKESVNEAKSALRNFGKEALYLRLLADSILESTP